MVKERVQPDCRLYSTLTRASFYQGNCEQAAVLLRTALGLPGGLPLDAKYATCSVIDARFVNEMLASLADNGCGQSLGASLLADIKKSKVRVNIDQSTSRQILSDVSGSGAQSSGKGKGKGKGYGRSW